jgi:quercetin dioxygenase-like cupin family protein
MRSSFVLTLALLGTTMLLGTAQGRDGYVAMAPADIKWMDFPLADRVQVSALYGAPDKDGIYTLRVKMQSGARLKIHTHPDTRMITVLSGKLHAGRGPTYDAAHETEFFAGSFFVVPAGTPHYVRADDGEVIYQENGFGPSPTNLLPE